MSLPASPKHLVVFGRPGSGKSTLAERLEREHGYTLVRTGEMLREAIRRDDFLGRRVAIHLAKGDLVPDLLIFELLEQRLEAPGAAAKLLFDGFPRTMGQVPLLDQYEKKLGFVIECYLEIALSRDEAVIRMVGRRVCPKCGATYHLVTKPPRVDDLCDFDGTPLESRKDDDLEVITFRQLLYDRHAGPILDHYRATDPEKCVAVAGANAPDEVYAEALQVLRLDVDAV